MKYGIKLKIYLRKNLIVRQCIMINIWKRKKCLHNVNFYDNKVPKGNERYACLSTLLLDFVVNADKKIFPQVFLGECKYATKEKKIMNTINEDESDDESDDEQNCANRDKWMYEQW